MTRLIAIAVPFVLAVVAGPAAPQSPWQTLSSSTTASLRGLSVVNDNVIWASGTRGTVLHSTDGGARWNVDTIPGASGLDLRAVHGRSGRVAHVAATAGRIWRTTDGGETWSLRYQAADTAVFLDAIVFADDRFGLALGDPVDGRFLVLVTRNGGDTWHEAPAPSRPAAAEGEAAFAASGSSLALAGGRFAWLGTGGTLARVYRSTDLGTSWIPVKSTLVARAGSGGVFSVAFGDSAQGIAVGGDYLLPDSSQATAAFTMNGGQAWQAASTMPRGYRSGVALVTVDGQLVAIAVGTNGTEFSRDGGRTWLALDDTGFNAVQFAPSGVAFAAGSRGRIATLDVRRYPGILRR